MKRSGILSLLAVIALIAAACGGDDAGEHRQIRVAATSPAYVVFAPVWIAEPLGYYEEENLTVDVTGNLPIGTGSDTLRAGQLDFVGRTASETIIVGDQTDEIISFIIDGIFPFMILTHEDSDINDAEDLRGALVGLRVAGDADVLRLLASNVGIGPDEYETVVVGGRVPGGIALDDGSIDALIGTFADRVAIAEDAGIPLRTLETGDVSRYYNSGYATMTDTLENDRDVVIRFGRAIAKAIIWQYENPEATLDLLAEVAPEAVADRDQAMNLLMNSNAWHGAQYEAQLRADPAIWQEMIDWYYENEMISEAYPAERIYTDELWDEIWDFDVEAVRAAAIAGEW